MQTRTDQVHSYEFFLQRVVSGLVARESDPAELPFRRLGWSGFGSVMVAIVVAGIVAIVGLLVGAGNDSWQDGDKIIQEKGSESIYVYIDERLHPVANLVSAQLITGGADVVRVSSRSLEGVQRGATLGIVGAPDLPGDSDDLLTREWTVCTQGLAEGESGSISVLGVGQPPAGGQVVGQGQAVLVRDTDPDAPFYYLVSGGYRYEVDPETPDVEDAVLQALSISTTDALPVSSAWVGALPDGDRLTLPPGYTAGAETVVIDGRELRVGQVIQDNTQFYVVRPDGRVEEITDLQAGIIRRLPGQGDPEQLSLSTEVQRVPLREQTATSPPREAPQVFTAVEHRGSACAMFPSGEFVPTVLAGGRLDPGNATPQASPEGSTLAAYVTVEGGKAALVQALSAPGDPGPQWHIVNDQGIQHPLRPADVAGMLGYPADRSVQMPSGLVDLLREGPTLDPAVARNPIPVPVG